MAINFCDGSMKPRIRTSSVTVDGHEVTNLTSPLMPRRSKGFMVESYIKPPVSITLWFPVNIELEKVVIATAVGSQRSCALEVYSDSQKRSDTWLNKNSSDKSKLGATKDGKVLDEVYACIGRAQDNDAQYFCFTNSSYRCHRDFTGLASMARRDIQGVCKTTELHSRHRYHLNNISHLVLRITRAIRSSSCAIRWLEVWGQPAYSCPKLWTSLILNQYNQAVGNHNVSSTSSDTSETSNKPSEISSEKDNVDPDLPEEFLDPLTNEMMLMPVLLPGGKTIDQSSLDRHVQHQAQWGHPPSDPFTGRLFSERDKPLPHNSLKLRMDQFLLRHPDIARKYDFRVGRTGNAGNTISQNQPLLTQSSLVSNESASSTHTSSGVINQCAAPVKRKHSNDLNYPTPKILRKNSVLDESQNSKATSTQTASTCTTDLDAALRNTLSGLPSFLHKPEPKPDTTTPMCVYCNKQCDISKLYRLVCSHVLCRGCLLVNSPNINGVIGLKCTVCQLVTERTSIIKAHV